jgi:hypothetical protein
MVDDNIVAILIVRQDFDPIPLTLCRASPVGLIAHPDPQVLNQDIMGHDSESCTP